MLSSPANTVFQTSKMRLSVCQLLNFGLLCHRVHASRHWTPVLRGSTPVQGSQAFHTVLTWGARCGHQHLYLIAFPLLCRPFNPGLYVSLFMNSVLLRVKLPRWLLRIPSARSGLPGTSRSEWTVLARLCVDCPRAWLHRNRYVDRPVYVKHCEWGSVCLSNLKCTVFPVILIGITLWGTILCV